MAPRDRARARTSLIDSVAVRFGRVEPIRVFAAGAYHRYVPDMGSPSSGQAGGFERATNRVALLVPGLKYSAERPLLHFAGAVFERHGWITREIKWAEQPPERDGQDFPDWFARSRSFVQAHIGQILERETAPRIALVGKSMGAFAAGLAADRSLPGIWLTPLLRDWRLQADLRRATAPFLLVGSTADPSWDSEVAHSFDQPCYEAQDADHSMETVDDPVHSADILRHVTAAMDAFVGAL